MTLWYNILESCKHVSTHMPLARHDFVEFNAPSAGKVSTHMPLARHDMSYPVYYDLEQSFYSHASCEA